LDAWSILEHDPEVSPHVANNVGIFYRFRGGGDQLSKGEPF